MGLNIVARKDFWIEHPLKIDREYYKKLKNLYKTKHKYKKPERKNRQPHMQE